ncbi:hypothetical protein FQR65_LT10427 [Abscondita terminalis]|nr:hypothetical protein FQR65_LT10427 [Abscondita terminalis]
MAMESVSSPSPHFLPGYTGFVPQYKYRIGDTYGTTTHKLLLDPTVSHAEKLVLSDRKVDDYRVYRPPKDITDIVNARVVQREPVFKHPSIPAYEGFVPRVHGMMGQRFTVLSPEAMPEDEQLQKKNLAALHQIVKKRPVQNEAWKPESDNDSQLTASEFKVPLLQVRPECARMQRNLPVDEAPLKPPDHSTSPFFLKTDKGFSGPVPFGYSSFGNVNKPIKNSVLCDFTTNYRKRLSTEWAPINVSRPDPPLLIQPSEIYHRHVGQVPNYTGHIPGAIFRYGKTYGSDSRDAKRWLRGDFS